MSDSELGGPRMTVTRRPHKKTRNGCGTCKRRRIKCDETKPACINCTKHSLTCVYGPKVDKPSLQAPPTTSTASNAPTPVNLFPGLLSPSTPGGNSGAGSIFADPMLTHEYTPALSTYGLAMDQLELMHQYMNFTSLTTAIGNSDRDYMRVTVPSVGMSYPFIMHECLALSALHLARFRHERREHYQSLAKFHNDAALRLATPTLREITSNNCDAVFIFTTLAFCYTLGKGPQEGDYMIFSDHGAAEAFPLLRGTRAVIESHESILKSGILAPIFRSARANLGPGLLPADIHDALNNLKADFLQAETEGLEMYIRTLDELVVTFSENYHADGTKRKMDSHKVWGWLYRVPMEYALGVQRKEPAALAILGYFCVLLNEISTVWWMDDWTKHILAAVYRFIGRSHRNWILWPMEQIGWLPSIFEEFSGAPAAAGNGEQSASTSPMALT